LNRLSDFDEIGQDLRSLVRRLSSKKMFLTKPAIWPLELAE
jgi:hypothetical protein